MHDGALLRRLIEDNVGFYLQPHQAKISYLSIYGLKAEPALPKPEVKILKPNTDLI